jgi:predicted AlkP superfamily phosphohydrolase/phosphomutase
MKTDRILIVISVVVLIAAAVVFVSKQATTSEDEVPPVVADPSGEVSLLVIGIKGLEESVVDRLIADGRLPNLDQLIERGARGRFATLGKSVDERIAWTSLVTGMAPERQGVGGKITNHRGEVVDAPLRPEFRTVDTIWTRLSARASGCGVLCWPGTWPVEEIDGLMVTPHSTYTLERSHGGALEENVWPVSASPIVDETFIDRRDLTRQDLARFINMDSVLGLESLVGQNYMTLADAYAEDWSAVELARRIVDERDIENILVCLAGSDDANQRFWHYTMEDAADLLGLEGEMRRIFEKQREALSVTVDRYCEFVDELVGELLDLAGDGTTVAVVNDNGYSGLQIDARGMPRIGKEMHSEEGFWILAGPHVAAGVTAEYGSLLDVAPTIMAAASISASEELDGRVHNEVLTR